MPIEPVRRHVVVTGTSSGIGLAITRQLLADGWFVFGMDVVEPAIADPRFLPLEVDLLDFDTFSSVVEALPAEPDALIHAAGIMRTGRLGNLSLEDGARMWSLHVQAVTLLTNLLAPRMASRGNGRVVLIGSRTAGGFPGRSQYAATKAALIALARSWAAEVAAQGVTVNVVSPGATETPMLRDPTRKSSAPVMPPIGRLVKPDEVAALVTYLLSPQAAAITGQNISICGGASLAM